MLLQASRELPMRLVSLKASQIEKLWLRKISWKGKHIYFSNFKWDDSKRMCFDPGFFLSLKCGGENTSVGQAKPRTSPHQARIVWLSKKTLILPSEARTMGSFLIDISQNQIPMQGCMCKRFTEVVILGETSKGQRGRKWEESRVIFQPEFHPQLVCKESCITWIMPQSLLLPRPWDWLFTCTFQSASQQSDFLEPVASAAVAS